MPLLSPGVDPLLTTPQDEGITEGVATWGEQLRAVYNDAIYTANSDSPSTAFRDVWSDVIQTIAERENKYFQNPGSYVNLDDAKGEYSEHSLTFGYAKSADEVITHVQQNPELYPEFNWLSREEIQKRAQGIALDARQELENIDRRSPGGIGFGTQLLGGVGAAATDPINQATLLLGAPGKGATLLGTMLKEGLLNMGVEAAIQSPVSEWYETLGLEYGLEEFLTNTGSAFVFGAGMPLAVRIGGKTISLTAEQTRRGLDALRKAGVLKENGPEQSVLGILDRQATEAKDNPLEDFAEHQGREHQAKAAAEANEPPGMSNKPASNPIRPTSPYDADNIDGVIFKFDPDEIQVDAKTFQFKEGGDEFGVTERLQGVTQWDPVAAGQIVVFEKADGSRFIADGHQRLGLAKRIRAADPSQDVRLYGHLIREVDGINEEMARVIAAIKNIKEGTGTAVDAAKVLRVSPEKIPELPPRSALVRQAQGLTLLDDEVFGAVINDLISPSYAAVIGRIMPNNKALQMNAVKILNKVEPRNEFEAESIVQQIKAAGAEERAQVDLFGEEVVAESYYLERARVLDRAMKQLRADKSSFNNLLNNAERLKAEGNELATEANQRRVTNDSQAIALLQAAANTKGTISDALSNAARLARDSGSYGEPVRNFVDAVRRGIAEGDFNGIAAGDAGQFVDAPAQIRPRENDADRAVDGFDDPKGPEFERQSSQLEEDLFGAQRAADEAKEITPTDPGDQIVRLSDMDGIEAKAFVVQTELKQNLKSIDDLMSRAETNHKQLSNDLLAAAKRLGGTAKTAPLKNRARVEQKVRDKYQGNLNRITDVARGGFEAPTAKAANDFIEALSEKYRIIDEGYSITDAGYFDRKLSVIFEDGQLGEVQIWAPGMFKAKEELGGHKLYEISRDLSRPIAEREDAIAKMRELYQGVRDALDPSWQKLLDDQLSSGIEPPKAATSLAATSRLTSGDLSSARISEADIGPQDLAPGSKPTILPGERSIAGDVPSTRKNLIDQTSDDINDIANANVKLDLDEEIPIDMRFDAEANDLATTTQTIREIQEEFAQDERMLARLEDCVK